MRYTTYSKYLPELLDAINLQDLLDQLSDFLLQSGFAGGPLDHPFWGEFGNQEPERSMDALRQAIIQALMDSGKLNPEMLKVLRGESTGDLERDREIERQLAELLDQIVQKLIEEGYLSVEQAPRMPQGHQPVIGPGGQAQSAAQQVQFNLTEKGIDFLGYRSLRHLLGSVGKSSFGSHDTQHLATGIEAEAVSKQYEFGDTMNLDVPETLKSALARGGRLVTCGATSGAEATTDIRYIYGRQLAIYGTWVGTKREMREVMRHVEAGRLRPVIYAVLPLAQAAEAHRMLERREQFGKIVLVP